MPYISGMENKTTVATRYSAKLVWFRSGPAWTCQKYGRHVITIHHGNTTASRKLAEETAAKLELIPNAN